MDKSAQRRCIILCLALIAGLSALSGRLVYLQVFDRTRYAETAENSYRRKEVIQANRGVLLDRNEEIIATSVISKSVVVDVQHLKDAQHVAKGVACAELRKDPAWKTWDTKKRNSKINAKVRSLLDEHSTNPNALVEMHLDYAISQLARPLGLTKEALRAKVPMERRSGERVIYQGLPTELAVRLERLIKERRIKGFFFREEKRRWYPAPELATHLIGYVNREGKGLAGVESSANKWLEGANGYEIEMRDIRGNVMPAHKGSFRPPNNGLNVQLTLDMGIQAICEEELDKGMAEFEAVRGCVVLMDPHTGEILAMASRPHYNLNLREKVVDNGFNFALQAVYEPGSTFKAIAAAAAINEGKVYMNTEIDCQWGYFRDGSVIVKDGYPKGVIPVWKILQKSNNIGSYKMAKMVGVDTYYAYAKAFGFGMKTNVQLAGESKGLLRNTGNPTDFSRISYGYGVSVTPLQIANAYCTIANGGKLMQPRIVKSIDTNSGLVIERFHPEVIGRAISEETAKTMREALKTVCAKEGTARRADVEGFTEGGKTGTAWRYDVETKAYQKDRHTVSFAGMLPAENPAFVCVVVIDDPQTTEVKHGGGSMAAPVWKRIAERTAAHMHLTPTEAISEQLTKNQ
ncbi:peptidoglycan D,D-transpeptidase FtsI family protein [Rubritalea tangerina]|uniref:Peptidoglycan D,D-transpeptidase FtsI family protein n=1 Tax=Rubritalea tangerina TaxID=430798 RepID=A0ABW4ZD48_9BACT